MRSIGTLADIAASPQGPEPDSTQAQIDALTKRVETLENLLADVMMQLDKPYQDEHAEQTPKPKPKAPSKAKKKGTAETDLFLEADLQAITDFGQQHGDRLWHMTTLAKAIRDTCGISRKRVQKALVALRENGTIKVIENVEVDGEMLKGAYQFPPKEENTN